MKKQIKKLFGNLFMKKLKTSEADKGKFKVVIIEDSELTYASLGISKERSDELTKQVIAEHKKKDSRTEALREISLHCKHQNELAYAAYIFGAISAMEANPIHSIMSKIFSK